MRSRIAAALTAVAALLAAPASAEWREATSEHFRIYADAEEQTLRAYAERLERFDGALRIALPPPAGSSDRRVTIFALPTLDELTAISPRATGAAGWYRDEPGDPVIFAPFLNTGSGVATISSPIILFHEYSHHYLTATRPALYPAWFMEGFAETMSTAAIERNGAVVLGVRSLDRTEGLGWQDLPLARLLGGEKIDRRDANGFYSKGWLLTHYLIFGDRRGDQLDMYLTAVDGGIAPMQAAAASFGPLDPLGRELRAYNMKLRLPALRIAPDRLAPKPVTIRRLGPGAQAMMPLHLRARAGQTPDAARGALARASRTAAAFPDDGDVQTWLAEIAQDAQDLDTADAAVGRAQAAVSSPIALRRRALIAMERARAARPPHRLALWSEARKRIVAANRADPNDASLLDAYYHSYVSAGIAPPVGAVAALRRAVQLAPNQPIIRISVARRALTERRSAEARMMLAGIVATRPANHPLSVLSQQAIGRIDSGKTDADLILAGLERAIAPRHND